MAVFKVIIWIKVNAFQYVKIIKYGMVELVNVLKDFSEEIKINHVYNKFHVDQTKLMLEDRVNVQMDLIETQQAIVFLYK